MKQATRGIGSSTRPTKADVRACGHFLILMLLGVAGSLMIVQLWHGTGLVMADLAQGLRRCQACCGSVSRFSKVWPVLTHMPPATGLLGLASAAGAAGVAVALGTIWRALGQSRRMRWAIDTLRDVDGRSGARGVVWLSSDPSTRAFTAGWLRPRTYAGEGLRRRRGQREAQAVLEHERFHRMRKDPLRRIVSIALGRLLFFLPAARWFSRDFRNAQQHAADAWAARRVGAESVRRALVRFMGWTASPASSAWSAGPRPSASRAPRRRRVLLAASLLGPSLFIMGSVEALGRHGRSLAEKVEGPCQLQRCMTASCPSPCGGGATAGASGAQVPPKGSRRAG